MFVTDDAEMLAKARQLWSFGETSTPTQKRDYHVYAMGWMYRNNDLTAAFGRAQLSKMDGYLAQAKINAVAFTAALQDVPGLILPTVPAGCEPNWYNYTLRFDMDALGHTQDASEFRFKIVEALQAEGVQTGVWQAFILPAMTVFQAKDGFGHGHPWSSPQARPVNYALDQYPDAQRHCNAHTGLTTPLRAPNGPDAVGLTAQGIRKVMDNVDQL
jgi:dTDP-4-amino-4,6-dideoxygalactose transaminase